ncbi:MAG: suppressor of fused domain protein [Propionibacteriaceae bacterium]|nr:suppressor of fused domain protein [Propionibacteriaceae bacterium]
MTSTPGSQHPSRPASRPAQPSPAPGMTREEFLAYAKNHRDWTPGWDAIDTELARLYPGQEPEHFAALAPDRVRFGGDQVLEGLSLYTSPKGYRHIVTYGLSTLAADVDALGGDHSGWGYELTMKLAETDTARCMWALDTLASLARYTDTTARPLTPGYSLAGSGSPVCPGAPAELTGLFVIPDTEARTTDTLFGKLTFNQVTAITTHDISVLSLESHRAPELHRRILADNPDAVIDVSRPPRSYL